VSMSLARRLDTPFVRFLATGGIAAGANILSRIALSMVLPFDLAVVIAYLVGMLTAYLLMRAFVFEASGRGMRSELTRFAIINGIALVQVWVVSVGLARWLFPAIGFTFHAQTVAHVIGVLSPVVTSYAGHKFYSFASRADGA
jgi:putative flippase GtrA